MSAITSLAVLMVAGIVGNRQWFKFKNFLNFSRPFAHCLWCHAPTLLGDNARKSFVASVVFVAALALHHYLRNVALFNGAILKIRLQL